MFQDAQDDLRRDQLQAGRTMAADEGFNAQPRKTLHVTGKRPVARPAAKPRKVEGHEAHLKALETSGATIIVTMASGIEYMGVVRHSDKYTISLRIKDATAPEGSRKKVLFKHAIDSYEPLTPGVRATETDESAA